MWKVACFTLTYLTVHHTMASINSSFHLELVEWRGTERTSGTPKSSAADDRSPAVRIYHPKYRYAVISTNRYLSYTPNCGKIPANYITDSPLSDALLFNHALYWYLYINFPSLFIFLHLFLTLIAFNIVQCCPGNKERLPQAINHDDKSFVVS